MAEPDLLASHCRLIVGQGLSKGRVVPFLGAGANLCGRPADRQWDPNAPAFLPTGAELAGYLAKEFDYKGQDSWDLIRVSQWVSDVGDMGWLYGSLHTVFSCEYTPTPLHGLLAALPKRLFRDRSEPPRYQLIVTTNYDDALERAFDLAGEPYHLVWYIAEGAEKGKFMHRAPGSGSAVLIDRPNEYVDVSTADATVILKIHGDVDKADPQSDSFVITEDHYIEYLTDGTEIANLVPVLLAKQLTNSSFLFLGYGLRDWNLRVILHRIWRAQKLGYSSWSIQKTAEEVDYRSWQRRGVEIITADLSDYVVELDRQIAVYALPSAAPA